MKQLQNNLKSVGNKLSASIELILVIMKMRFKLTDQEFDILRSHFTPHIDDNSEHGWEELTNAAMSHLLKTCLSKSGGGVV